jgi:hypothetical protein
LWRPLIGISAISFPGYGAVMHPGRVPADTVESRAKLSSYVPAIADVEPKPDLALDSRHLPQNRKAQFNGPRHARFHWFWTQPHRRHRQAAPKAGSASSQLSIIDAPTASDRTGRSGTREHAVVVILLPYCGSLRFRTSPGPRWRRIIPGVALWQPTERIWCER